MAVHLRAESNYSRATRRPGKSVWVYRYISEASGDAHTCHFAGELAPLSFLSSFARLRRLFSVSLDLVPFDPLYLCWELMILEDNVVSMSQGRKKKTRTCLDSELCNTRAKCNLCTHQGVQTALVIRLDLASCLKVFLKKLVGYGSI